MAAWRHVLIHDTEVPLVHPSGVPSSGVAQAARIFLMICNAVSYLHERQLVGLPKVPELSGLRSQHWTHPLTVDENWIRVKLVGWVQITDSIFPMAGISLGTLMELWLMPTRFQYAELLAGKLIVGPEGQSFHATWAQFGCQSFRIARPWILDSGVCLAGSSGSETREHPPDQQGAVLEEKVKSVSMYCNI